MHPFFSIGDGRKRLHAGVRAELTWRTTSIFTERLPASSAIWPRRAPLLVTAPGDPAALAYRALWAEISGR